MVRVSGCVYRILGLINRIVDKKRYMEVKKELYTLLNKSVELNDEAYYAKTKYIQTCNELLDSLEEDNKRYIDFLRQDVITKSEHADAIEEEYRIKWECFQKRYREDCRIRNIKVYDYLSSGTGTRCINISNIHRK